MGDLLSLPPIFSTLLRLVSYIFLQVIPTRLAIPILPPLYIGYLSSLYLSPDARPNQPPLHDKTDEKKLSDSPEVCTMLSCSRPCVLIVFQPKKLEKQSSLVSTILFGLPSRQRSRNVVNILINTVLLLACLDLALNPLLFPEEDVTFSRIGAVYPDGVKVTLRYPIADETTHDVQVLYREVSEGNAAWKDGPVVSLSKEHDWVNTTRVAGLWPDTKYECECPFHLVNYHPSR